MAAKRNTKSTNSSNSGGISKASSDGLEVLKQKHEEIRSICKALEGVDLSGENLKKLGKLCSDWVATANMKRAVVLPAYLEAGIDKAVLASALIEADIVAVLLSNLVDRNPDDPMFQAIAKSALDTIPRALKLEEQEAEGLFSKAREAGVDLKELAHKLQNYTEELGRHAEDTHTCPRPRYLRSATPGNRSMETPMAGMDRPRDERGRFVDEDDYRARGSYGGRGFNSRYDEDDHRRSSRGRQDDDDRRGWYGDSRGHAEAARRGWDERRSGRYDEDDRRRDYRSRADFDDDYRRSSLRGRGHGGWFGDHEGHAEASRRGWDNPDHGPSGWYGESEGHAQAARRGWDNPDHGPSGWYGDPEGHAQASRRGWDERRGSSRYDEDEYDRRRRR